MIISKFTSTIRFLKRLLERKEFSPDKNSQENSEIDQGTVCQPYQKVKYGRLYFPKLATTVSPVQHLFLTV